MHGKAESPHVARASSLTSLLPVYTTLSNCQHFTLEHNSRGLEDKQGFDLCLLHHSSPSYQREVTRTIVQLTMSAPYLFSRYALPVPFKIPQISFSPITLEISPTNATSLLCRAIDPFFAAFIGVTAAGVRINREEKEKGRSRQESWESLKRRWAIVMENTGQDGVGDGSGGAVGAKEVGKRG